MSLKTQSLAHFSGDSGIRHKSENTNSQTHVTRQWSKVSTNYIMLEQNLLNTIYHIDEMNLWEKHEVKKKLENNKTRHLCKKGVQGHWMNEWILPLFKL